MSNDIVLVSSGYDMNIRFWSDFNNGTQCKCSIEYKDSAINALEISPNKEHLAFAAGNSIKFLNLEKLEPNPVASIDSHEGLVSCILMPQLFDNKFISAGEDCTVRINDTRVGKAVQKFEHGNYVNSVAFDSINKNDVIAADENGTIKIWDIRKEGAKKHYDSDINEEGLAFRSISLAEKEGFLVGAKSNGSFVVFDYNDNSQGQTLTKLKTIDAHKNYITKCLLSPDNKMLATCGADNEIKLWQRKRVVCDDEPDSKEDKELSKDFELKKTFIGHKKWVWDCDFSLDSLYLLSCSSDKTIRIWSIENGKVIATFNNPKGVNNIALADDAESN